MGRALLPGESEVQRWSGLVLTSHRLLYSVEGSTASSTSLLLRALEWSTIGRSHRPLLLVAALFEALFGVGALEYSHELAYANFSVALVALVAYLATRHVAITFAAGEGRIRVVLRGKGREGAKSFANAVDQAALRAVGLPL